MNFLYPLFLAGCLAIILPIIFHFIRRSTQRKVPFSSLRFLQASPPRLTRKSRLENLWLLLLRCLILLLLAFAFARPYLEKALSGRAALQNPSRNLFLLDISASMRRDQAWDRALSLLSKKLSEIDPQSLSAAYAFDTGLHPIMSFAQCKDIPFADRSRQIISRARQQTPSWRATHLGFALFEAIDLLEESLQMDQGQDQDWHIFIISDLQSGMLLDGIGELEWHKGCMVEFIPVELDESTNAGIHTIPNLRAGFENEAARIRISNSSESRKETFEYGWIERSTDLQITSKTEIYLPSGKGRVVKVPKQPTHFSPDILRLIGDDHDFDNIAWRVPLRARQSQVFYFGENDLNNSKNSSQPFYYLQKAFQQTHHHIVHLKRLSSDHHFESEIEAQLVVIASPLVSELVEKVRKCISNGTNGLLILHRDDLAQTLQNLLGEPLNIVRRDSRSYALLGEIDFQHPIFHSFADPRFSDFSKIKFWRHYEIDPMHLEELNANVLARFDDGSAAFTQFDLGKGSLFVVSFGWQPQQSQFALSTKFVPILYSILDFGKGTGDVKSHYLIGQSVDLSSLTGNLSITKPDGKRLSPTGKRFDETSIPGIYKIETSDENEISFAVNLHPRESETAPLPKESLMGLGIPTASEFESKIAESARARIEAAEIEANQKYWKWIMLFALVIATIETLMAGILSHRSKVT